MESLWTFQALHQLVGFTTVARDWLTSGAANFTGFCGYCAWIGGHGLGWFGLGAGGVAASAAGAAAAADTKEDWDPEHLIPTDPRERYPARYSPTDAITKEDPIGWAIKLFGGGAAWAEAAAGEGFGHAVLHVGGEALIERGGEWVADQGEGHKEPVHPRATTADNLELQAAYDSLEKTLKDIARQKATHTEPWR